MRFLIVIFCTFFYVFVFGQSRIIYPYQWKDTNYEKVVSNIQAEIVIETDSSKLCRYYFLSASAYANLDSTKTVIALEKSYKLSTEKFCYFLNSLENNYSNKDTPDWVKEVKYYLHEPKFSELNLKYLNICSKNHVNSKKEKLHKIIEIIKLDDQRFRGDITIDWQSQDRLDEINRDKLDSLFLEDELIFRKYSNQEIEIIWTVLQHSNDCSWNKKWLLRFLDAYQDEDFDGRWLKFSFERFYEPDDGFCSQQNLDEAKSFINLLKSRYPEEYKKRFGYTNY